MLKELKKTHANLYALYVSLLLALWFNGISSLLYYFLPVRGFILSVILMAIPLIIFIWDDGTLDELYKVEEDIITAPMSQTGIIANITQQADQQQYQAQIRNRGLAR